MARIAQVVSIERVDEEGSKGTNLVVDEGGNTVTLEHYQPPGVDACPLEGDFVAMDEERENAVAYADVKNEDASQPGEIRIYARKADGSIVVDLWLKKDGSLQAKNDKAQITLGADGKTTVSNDDGTIEMASNGKVTINGVEIDTDGNIKAPGEVTAKAASLATSVTLSQHKHPHPMGPTSSATPGT